jgi:signal transduction histidine kinase
MRRTLLKPPVFEDEDKTRLASSLHVILLFLIVVLGTYAIVVALISGQTRPALFLLAHGSLIVISIGLWFLMRRGYVRAAGIIFLLVSWCNISVQAWMFGGTRDSSFAAYSLVIVASGLLLSPWHCLGFAGLSILAGWGLAYAETVGALAFSPDPPYSLWIDHSLNFVILTLVVVLLSNSLNTALARARRGEREVMEKNRELEAIRASLEIRVAERTQRLAEQNTQLQLEIEERHQAQTALQEALDREREMLDDVRLNLSLALPHELRTPLSSILGFSQLLLRTENLPEPDRIVKYAHGIHTGAVRLHRLVENTLLYANLRFLQYAADSPGSTRIEWAYRMKDVVIAVGQECAKNAQREDDLCMEIEDIRIYALPEHFKKILTEILDNAFKFSTAGTPVRVTTQAHVHDQCYTIDITDQGRGMSPEELETIGAYVQFERKHYEQQGMGLGLVIASLLTQLEGGELTLHSEKERGTRIRLRFVCAPMHKEGSEK